MRGLDDKNVSKDAPGTCDFAEKRWGEIITPSEVDKAIAKLEEKKK